MLKHIQNEVILLKCLDATCNHCTKNPVKAEKLFKMLKEKDMKMFAPLPSTAHEGHYCTYVEMCDKDPKDLPTGDMGMPSAVGSELGMC